MRVCIPTNIMMVPPPTAHVSKRYMLWILNCCYSLVVFSYVGFTSYLCKSEAKEEEEKGMYTKKNCSNQLSISSLSIYLYCCHRERQLTLKRYVQYFQYSVKPIIISLPPFSLSLCPTYRLRALQKQRQTNFSLLYNMCKIVLFYDLLVISLEF